MSADAAAEAAAWIAASPNLIDVLTWHAGLCETCGNRTPGTLRRCAEYTEIIEEYGAGPYGSAVFFPVAEL